MHICLVNLPRYEIHRPPLSLAILSTICDQENVDYSCIDLSFLIWKELNDDFFDIDDFCITKTIDDQVKGRLQELIDNIIQTEISKNADTMFALSLLSMWSQPVAELFCQRVKELSKCEVLVGGQGLVGPEWTNKMKDQYLIDHFIVGEGEISFKKFLQGHRTGPGINNFNFEQIDDLDQHVVIPNYTKLPISEYPYLNNVPSLYITASRGCIRNCSYCDIGHQWKKYRYRDAKNVAQEMITQYERHGINEFFFTDSLINGSMKMLDELCNVLIDYKEKNPEANFKWQGQYIFRPKDTVKEHHIEKLARAGVDYLIIGLETGSDYVRHSMNKKHTTDDAEWFLTMFQKYKIQCRLLMITGYVTERLEDHYSTLELFPRWQKFVASETITGIELGSILMILDNSPVGKQKHELEMSFINDNPHAWHSGVNPDLDLFERVRRRIETHREAIKYNWPITRSQYRLNTIKRNFLQVVDHLKNNPNKNKKRIPILG